MKIDYKKYEQGKDFIKALLALKDYIENDPRPDLGTDIDRFLFSMLVMFDGDSSVNNFKSIDLGFNDDYYLHELYSELRDKAGDENENEN